MSANQVRTFANQFKKVLEEQGVSALGRFNWPQRCRDLGFEMDCGHSFEGAYGLQLGNERSFAQNIGCIDNIQVLGNAIFSQCRYITHWAYDPDNESVAWLIMALTRLSEIAGESR